MTDTVTTGFDIEKAMYIVTPQDIKGINLLIYGYQGAGKTHFAVGAQDVPEMANVLLLNIEGGTMTVAEREDIATVDVKSLEMLEEIFWLFARNDPRVDRFKTIIIDSLTELQTINLESITDAKPRNKDIIAQDDYGKSTKAMKRILRMFRDLPRHVIYVALPKEKQNEDGNVTTIMPSLTASLSESVQGYMDLVWYLYAIDEKVEKEIDDGEGNKRKEMVKTGNKVRRILTQETGLYRGKTRGPKFAEALGNPLTDPTMKKVFDIWTQKTQ